MRVRQLEALFHALRSRRTYATSGPRILLDFTLNGEYPMGSEVSLPPLTNRTFEITIRRTAPVERVEIIHQGAVLAVLETNGTPDLDLRWTDPRCDAPLDNSHYYVRIRQIDGHCAWSSPIWIDYQE